MLPSTVSFAAVTFTIVCAGFICVAIFGWLNFFGWLRVFHGNFGFEVLQLDINICPCLTGPVLPGQ
jgi:hypothetical protein